MKKSIKIVLILPFVGYVIYNNTVVENRLRNTLLTNGHYSIATITSIEHNTNRLGGQSVSTVPHFSFMYNGKTITASGNGIIQKQEDYYFADNYVGRKFYVIFLPEDPNQNSILPYCFPPDSLKIPNLGWEKLPTGKLELIIGTTTDDN